MAGKPKAQPWQNRIVGYGVEQAGQLTANPLNWRIHPQAQQAALSGVLEEIGWVQNVIVNKASGVLIDGHLRVSLALRMGEETEVPVTYVELSPEEEATILATLDPLAAMTATDKEKLDELLHAVETASPAVTAMLAELAEKSGLDWGKPEEADAEPQIDRAEELRVKWGVELGQLWQIGEHRLICGDCTDRAVVERVMGGERAALYITDPPYGVSYADKNRFLNAVWPANRVEEPILGDHQTPEDMADLWLRAFTVAFENCADGCAYYVCSPQGGELMMMMMMMMRAGFLLKHTIIWVKNQFVIGRSDYHYKHEPLIYGWKDGGHKFYGGRGECSVWEIDKPRVSDSHPTMKPVELFMRATKNSSIDGDIVFDGFGGSGTTMVACQNLSRKCRMVEISPGYCGVILERMATAFPALTIAKVD